MELIKKIAEHVVMTLHENDVSFSEEALIEALQEFDELALQSDVDEFDSIKDTVDELIAATARNESILQDIETRLYHMGKPVTKLEGDDLQYIHEQWEKLCA